LLELGFNRIRIEHPKAQDGCGKERCLARLSAMKVKRYVTLPANGPLDAFRDLFASGCGPRSLYCPDNHPAPSATRFPRALAFDESEQLTITTHGALVERKLRILGLLDKSQVPEGMRRPLRDATRRERLS